MTRFYIQSRVCGSPVVSCPDFGTVVSLRCFVTEGTFAENGVHYETASLRCSHCGIINRVRLCPIDQHHHRRVLDNYRRILNNHDDAEHWPGSDDRNGFDHHEWNEFELGQGLRARTTDRERQAGRAWPAGHKRQFRSPWAGKKDYGRLLNGRRNNFWCPKLRHCGRCRKDVAANRARRARPARRVSRNKNGHYFFVIQSSKPASICSHPTYSRTKHSATTRH